ncbi:PrsW family intramembrane metalloprotease [uncultured Propionibacterium sp.]|uniref:PrsW family intramembrane metalloprotease n=1 Tax=uncultured Propionibacterium sp. TaxID=218066 RepID=UPI00292E344E|nr:PrsW family intramembrane metalloprotease [uncultured Propionibacterium sp.]
MQLPAPAPSERRDDSVARERRARRIAGLPRPVEPGLTGWRRFRRSPLNWLTVAFFPLCALLLWLTYRVYAVTITTSVGDYTEQQTGTRSAPTPAQFNEALWKCTRMALVTLAIGLVFYLLIDRLRPTTLRLKAVALAWGGAVAVYASAVINTWASMRVTADETDELGSVRAAIFIAPFTEEAAKATVLFLLAILVRHRFLSAIQMVTMAGLSAVGFAVVEDIVYYIRMYLYGSLVYGVDADESLRQIFYLRGLLTCWGHPLFTTFTAIGVGVAMRNRSKLVRVTAPLAGYCFAVCAHMGFNGTQSIGVSTMMLLAVGAFLIIFLLLRYFRLVLAESRQVRARLQDFVSNGWLGEHDPIVFSRYRRRLKLICAAALRGPRCLLATVRLIHDMSELAQVRMGVVNGLVDGAAVERERELLLRIRSLRGRALDDTDGLTIKPPNWTLQSIRGWVGAHLPRRRPRTPVFAPPPPSQIPVGAPRR